MPVQVTHNNDGHFYTIDVDLAKEGAEVFDLTTYFKARVADSNVGLRFRWFWQGQVFNTVGKKPRVVGLVGQYSFKKADNGINRELVMSPDASAVAFTGDVNDCEPGGYATYYFPEQMFPQDGMFKGTVGLLDDSGETARYTSVDIWFKVYPQAGGAQMGKACDYYISELDKTIKEAEDDLANHKKSMQQVVDEFVSKMNDLTNRLETQANTDQMALDALEQKIKQDGLFTQAEADAFKQAIMKAISLSYSTVSDMKQADLKAGQYAETKGYYLANDGGGASYLIVSAQPENKHYEQLTNGMYAALIANDYVNVKQLGAKEDASVDLAPIVNANTALYDLFLPAGNYYANSTIKLLKSIKGVGGGRLPDSKITSQLDSGKLFDGSKLITESSIEGIDFIANNEDITVSIPITEYKNLTIRNIGIENVVNKALEIDDTFGTSRACYIDGLTIYGSSKKLANSTGLIINGAKDSRIQDLEIMGCQTGYKLKDTFIYGSNWHIWCGSLAGGDSDWQNATTAIYLSKASIYVSLAFTDSAFNHYYFNGVCSANITNLVAMNDSDSVKRLDSSTLVAGDGSSQENFCVNGGTVFVDEKFLNISRGKMRDIDIKLRIDKQVYFSRLAQHDIAMLANTRNFDADYQTSIPSNANGQPALIAQIIKYDYTRTKFTVANVNDSSFEVEVYYAKGNTRITKTTRANSQQQVLYKDSPNSIDIYAISSPGTVWNVSGQQNRNSALIATAPPATLADISTLQPIKDAEYSTHGNSLKFRLSPNSSGIVVCDNNVGLLRYDGSKLMITVLTGSFDNVGYSVNKTGQVFLAQVKSGEADLKVII